MEAKILSDEEIIDHVNNICYLYKINLLNF